MESLISHKNQVRMLTKHFNKVVHDHCVFVSEDDSFTEQQAPNTLSSINASLSIAMRDNIFTMCDMGIIKSRKDAEMIINELAHNLICTVRASFKETPNGLERLPMEEAISNMDKMLKLKSESIHVREKRNRN